MLTAGGLLLGRFDLSTRTVCFSLLNKFVTIIHFRGMEDRTMSTNVLFPAGFPKYGRTARSPAAIACWPFIRDNQNILECRASSAAERVRELSAIHGFRTRISCLRHNSPYAPYATYLVEVFSFLLGEIPKTWQPGSLQHIDKSRMMYTSWESWLRWMSSLQDRHLSFANYNWRWSCMVVHQLRSPSCRSTIRGSSSRIKSRFRFLEVQSKRIAVAQLWLEGPVSPAMI